MLTRPEPSIEPAGFFVLRTPLLPWSTVSVTLGEDRVEARRELIRLVRMPMVREAIYLGSPDLERSIDTWIASPDAGRGPGIERSVLRYVVRAASRSTPFGLFAGTSVGLVGERTHLRIEERERYSRHSTLDINCLSTAAAGAVCSPQSENLVPLLPNPSLYRSGGRLRWYRSCAERGVGMALMAAPESPRINAALGAASGGRTAADLAAALGAHHRDASAAAVFVRRLVQLHVLVPALDPTVTGREPIHDLIDRLAEAGGCVASLMLSAVARELACFDAHGLGVAPVRYRRLARKVEEVTGTERGPASFHVDLSKPAPEATLGQAVINEIIRGVTLLHRVVPSRRAGDLERFVNEFQRRYAGREVPLLEAVDAEAGVGFGPAPTPWALASYDFPPADQAGAPVTDADDLLLERLMTTVEAGRTDLVLDDADIEALAGAGSHKPLPGAFAVVAQVAAGDQEALDAGDFSVHVRSVGGPSGAWLLGRFCHADEQLRFHVEQHLRAEEAQDPDAVWAELVHLPPGPLGNVVLRPVLRKYEIACFGSSGANPELQIALGDLVVSIHDGAVVLRSRRLGRRVVVRGTTAHDFARSGPAVYRLLASLQTQGVSGGLAWSWGALANAPFLPRVVHGRIVLSLARWRLSRAEVGSLCNLSGAKLLRHLGRWREERHLPSLVSLVDGNGGLLVNLESAASAESFAQALRPERLAVVEEVFPAPEQLGVRGPEGAYMHELVVPFTAHGRPPATVRPHKVVTSVRRRFPPGSEWISAKVYCRPARADHNLRETVGPLAQRLVAAGQADSWFFLRYGDPDWHLRCRVHVPSSGNPASALHQMYRVLGVLVQEGLAERFDLDTYEPEVERYGGPEGIRLAERIFSIDSDAVLGLLADLPAGDDGAEERWLLALRSVDQLLDDLGVRGDRRLDVLQRGRAIYAHEHRLDSRLEASFSKQFRQNRARVEEALDGGPAGSLVALSASVLEERARRLRPLVGDLRVLARLGELSEGVDELATSFVHLHLNRLLVTAHRAQELVVYDTLLRVERSRRARGG